MLARYLRPHSARVVLLLACLLASTGLQLFIPQIVRAFIDRGVGGAAVDELAVPGFTYLGLSIVIQLVTAAASYASADIGWRTTNRLRVDLLWEGIRILRVGEFLERLKEAD